VAHDREFARVVGVRVVAHDAALYGVTAALVVVGTLSQGPLPVFALLVLPPLGARVLVRSLAGFLALAAVLGVVGAAAGAALSFGLDLPLGAAAVVGAGLVTGAAVVWRRGQKS